MYAVVLSSAVVAGLVTAGTLVPIEETPQPSSRVVITSCDQPSYAPAPPKERAACSGSYTSYGVAAR